MKKQKIKKEQNFDLIKELFQNYGIDIDKVIKKIILLTFILTFMLVFVFIAYKIDSPSDNDLGDYMTSVPIKEEAVQNNETISSTNNETYAFEQLTFIDNNMFVFLLIPFIFISFYFIKNMIKNFKDL